MDTQTRIDSLVQTLKDSGLYTPTSAIYAEGVKAKLRQASFCLESLAELEPMAEPSDVQDGASGPTVQRLLSITEEVNLYCDAFWDFLRSSIDILAQLINELRRLSISERDVDFKRVADKMTSTAPGTRLEEALRKLRNSRAFKELEDYRHCSTHRRPIYIHTTSVTTATTGTPGYYFGGSVSQTVVTRYLCTNPWDTAPKIDHGKRQVVIYCESLLRGIEKHIDRIVGRLL